MPKNNVSTSQKQDFEKYAENSHFGFILMTSSDSYVTFWYPNGILWKISRYLVTVPSFIAIRWVEKILGLLVAFAPHALNIHKKTNAVYISLMHILTISLQNSL